MEAFEVGDDVFPTLIGDGVLDEIFIIGAIGVISVLDNVSRDSCRGLVCANHNSKN